MNNNKWTISVNHQYQLADGQLISRTTYIPIPPTDGDRTDIIDTDGHYYYNMTKAKFMENLTKEEYLEQCLPNLQEKEKAKILQEITSTPRRINAHIELIIEIKAGNISLKGK
jgi:hypothetical protein